MAIKKNMKKKTVQKKAGPADVFMSVSGMNKEGAALLKKAGFKSIAEFGERPVMEILLDKIYEKGVVNNPEDAQRLLNCIKLCKLEAVRSDKNQMKVWEQLLAEKGVTIKVAWTLLMAGVKPADLKGTSLSGVYDTVMSKSDVSFRQLQDLYLSLSYNKLDSIKRGVKQDEETPGPYSRIPGP